MSGWRIVRVTGAFPTAVSFWLERSDPAASIQILVRQRAEGPCLQATPLGDVSYRRVSGLNGDDAAGVTRSFAKLLLRGDVPITSHFPHLASAAEIGDESERLRLAQLVGQALPLLGDRPGGFARDLQTIARRELVFDPPGIAEFLAPEIPIDAPALPGWLFRGVYLPSVARRQSADFTSYVLEFGRDDREQMARLILRVDNDDPKAFARCGRLSLTVAHDGELDEVPAESSSLASWVAALLRLRSSAQLEIVVPRTLAEVRALSYPPHPATIESPAGSGAGAGEAEPVAPPPALNLALDPECGQRCVFCSVKSYVTPTDAGAADLEDALKQLQQSQELGVREVRLNGIDPLRHSRVLEVIEAVQGMGFPALTIYSTGRRLAEASFRREVLRRAPKQLTVCVPLYGLSAATHDAVTGSPGSQREVLEAIAGLRADGAESAVRISTVFVRQNVDEIVPMLRWIRRQGLGDRVDAHLPYPMRPTTRDPYVDSAMPESELLGRLLADIAALTGDERAYALAIVVSAFRHPCVRWQAERDSGLPVLGDIFPEGAVPLAGTEYRSDKFVHASGTADGDEAFAVAVVECPRALECALAPLCPREHYGVYAQHFGLAEFDPVRPVNLYRHRALGRER